MRPSTRLSTLELDEQTSLAKLRQSQPPRLIGLIRGDLDWIVMKALEKERRRRYESPLRLATDIRRFLDQQPIEARPPSKRYRFGKMVRRHKVAFASATVLASGLLVAAIAILFAFKVSQNSKLAAVPAAKRVAILTFSNASPNQVEAYLSESLTRELIRTFGKVRGLSAFRPSAAFATQPMDQIRASLSDVANVPLLVTGTIKYRDGHLVISARVIETATGTELVSAPYEREPGNMLGIPDDLVLRIADQTLPNLTAKDRARISKTPTQNPEAYDHYLRGTVNLRGLFAPNVGLAALKDLEEAVKLDRDFALAWAELSHAYVSFYFYSEPEERPVLETKAFQAFTRALDLDPDLAEAHFAKTYYYWTPSQNWQIETAINEGHRALELNPNLQEVYEQLSLIYLHCGLFRQGGELADQARKINPQLGTYNLKANILFWEGKSAEAVDLWGTNREQVKLNFVMNSYLAVAQINLGHTNEAEEVIQTALKTDFNPLGALFASVRAIQLAKQGKKTEALAQISQALQQRKQFGHFHHALYNIACAYALLNDKENALTYLHEAAADGLACWPLFYHDVNLESLREDQKFKDFLAGQRAIYDKYVHEFGN